MDHSRPGRITNSGRRPRLGGGDICPPGRSRPRPVGSQVLGATRLFEHGRLGVQAPSRFVVGRSRAQYASAQYRHRRPKHRRHESVPRQNILDTQVPARFSGRRAPSRRVAGARCARSGEHGLPPKRREAGSVGTSAEHGRAISLRGMRVRMPRRRAVLGQLLLPQPRATPGLGRGQRGRRAARTDRRRARAAERAGAARVAARVLPRGGRIARLLRIARRGSAAACGLGACVQGCGRMAGAVRGRPRCPDRRIRVECGRCDRRVASCGHGTPACNRTRARSAASAGLGRAFNKSGSSDRFKRRKLSHGA